MTYRRMLILALIFAVFAAFGAYTYLNDLAAQANIKEMPYVSVAVAKTDIPINKVIEPQDIQMRNVAVGDEHPKTYRNTKDLIGKVAVTNITSGEQILSSKVASKGNKEMGLSFIVEEGMRAVTVAVSEVTAVGYMIKPGDKVDLLVRVNKDLPTKQKVAAVTTMLQNIKVLSIGQNFGSEPINQKATGEVKTVTIEVYPQDAEKVFLASQDARLLMTLRAPGEEEVQKVPHVEYKDLAPEFLSDEPIKTNTPVQQNPVKVSPKKTVKKGR